MYMGTREHMTDVRCPAINVVRNREKWTTSGTYLNGGGFARGSSYSHALYTIAWNLMSPDEARKILDYYYGVYGQGLIYFLDDFALQGNVLPLHWSVPRLTVEDAPPLVRGATVTETPLSAVNNVGGYPSASATYTWTGAPNNDAALWIPVPPGQNFYFGVRGSRTGDAGVMIVPDRGEPVSSGAPLPTTTLQRTNMTLPDPGGVQVVFYGTSGSLTLNSMYGSVGTTPPPRGNFRSGEGHTGVEFDGVPQRTGYSAVIGEGLESVSSAFKEVGAWR